MGRAALEVASKLARFLGAFSRARGRSSPEGKVRACPPPPGGSAGENTREHGREGEREGGREGKGTIIEISCPRLPVVSRNNVL